MNTTAGVRSVSDDSIDCHLGLIIHSTTQDRPMSQAS